MACSASTTSSMTSTSHTLTGYTPSQRFLVALADSTKPTGDMEMLALFEAIKPGNRHDFLQPSIALPNASLQLVKATLDAYASQLSDEQQLRQREANKKRKRSDNAAGSVEVLKVRKLHVDGFESNQVWQQAKRVINSTLQDAEHILQELEDRDEVQLNGIANEDITGLSDEDSIGEYVEEDDEQEDEEDEDEDEDEDENEDEGSRLSDEELEGEIDQLEDDLEEDIINDEDDNLDGEDDGEDDGEEEEEQEDDAEPLVEDPNGLNDGFFSIDEFNKQTQIWEDADARADPNIDQESDDDELDWHTDPFSAKQSAVKNGNSKKSNKSRHDEEDDGEMQSGLGGEDDDDDEGGATFGDMDLDAPEGDSEVEDDENPEDADESNANDVFYKDFFAPPRRKGAAQSKPRKFAATRLAAPTEGDVERAMADVRRDLFEDESEHGDSEDALSEVDAGDPKSRRSVHERRQAKLAEEIRKLEAANVSKKDWTMSGEARAIERPVNSLLEEDLDFEHAGKPIAVITADVNESIEDLIKRRILAREFDEVIRRRPDASEFSSHARRGLVSVEDTKSKQGLAEIYEEEHVKNANPDSYVSKADEKLLKEEKEIEQMWKEISGKLDALSSWHYRPKPVAPSLSIVADVATISMEDAQPTTAQGVSGGDTTLAPQEVYKGGKENAEKGEVVTKSGLPVAKQEMTREDKSRRRRREKERIRKAGGLDSKKPQSAKAQQRKDTLGDLRKGGVKVINKKGEVVDIDGNKAKAAKTSSSSIFKL